MTDIVPAAQPLIDALLGSDYFVARNAVGAEIVRSSNRPVSNVYQVRVQMDPSSELFWIKTHSQESLGDAEREYRFLTEARRSFVESDELGIPEVVTYLPELAALVSEHVGGIPLVDLIRSSLNRFAAPFANRAEILRHLERCGSWLSRLHSSALPESELFDLDVLREYVDIRLRTLVNEDAIDRVYRERVMSYLEAAMSEFSVEDRIRVRTHGDYAPYNILVGPGRLNALDPGVGIYLARLDNHSSRYDDVVHFYRFTSMMSRHWVGDGVRKELANAFLRGYQAGDGPHVNPQSGAFRAFRLKYELIDVTGMAWPSLIGRLTSRRMRLARFKHWFKGVCRDRGDTG